LFAVRSHYITNFDADSAWQAACLSNALVPWAISSRYFRVYFPHAAFAFYFVLAQVTRIMNMIFFFRE
jgi:TorA maturation chaperone TorD